MATPHLHDCINSSSNSACVTWSWVTTCFWLSCRQKNGRAVVSRLDGRQSHVRIGRVSWLCLSPFFHWRCFTVPTCSLSEGKMVFVFSSRFSSSDITASLARCSPWKWNPLLVSTQILVYLTHGHHMHVYMSSFACGS